jgi:hypothetical protein
MPVIGQRENGHKIGYKSNTLHEYLSCPDCGKIRWIQVMKGKPRNLRCSSCAMKGDRHPYFGKRGEETPAWKGGQYTSHTGYVFIATPNHPSRSYRGYVKRSVLVLEQKLGRLMLPNADCHHINGIKDDDRPDNLEEVPHVGHSIYHDLGRARTVEGRFQTMKGGV